MKSKASLLCSQPPAVGSYLTQHNQSIYTHQNVFQYFTSNDTPQSWVKVKVKVTLEQAMKAQRGSRSIALFFL
jgi:hypothetical protein